MTSLVRVSSKSRQPVFSEDSASFEDPRESKTAGNESGVKTADRVRMSTRASRENYLPLARVSVKPLSNHQTDILCVMQREEHCMRTVVSDPRQTMISL